MLGSICMHLSAGPSILASLLLSGQVSSGSPFSGYQAEILHSDPGPGLVFRNRNANGAEMDCVLLSVISNLLCAHARFRQFSHANVYGKGLKAPSGFASATSSELRTRDGKTLMEGCRLSETPLQVEPVRQPDGVLGQRARTRTTRGEHRDAAPREISVRGKAAQLPHVVEELDGFRNLAMISAGQGHQRQS